MPGTEPSGPDEWDATLCRLAELAGARPALCAELVERLYGAGWRAAIAEVHGILRDVPAEDPALCLEMRADWNGALDAVRVRLALLQASGEHEAATDPG